MANVTASSSTNLGTAPLSPTEINFEDLITVNNVLLDQSPGEEDSTMEDNISSSPNHEIEEIYSVIAPKPSQPTSATILQQKNPDLSITQQKIVSLTKIVPKQTTTTTTAKISANVKSSNPGQVVIIQGPSGPVPIRIAGSSTASKVTGATTQNANNAKTATISPKESSTNKGQPVTIQVLKMPDGSLVPLKNNKALNLTNLSNISQLNVGSGTPVILKTTNGQKVVTGTQNKLGSGAPVLKSLTLAEVQKAGFIKPKPLDGAGINKLQKILPSPTSTAAPSTIASTTVTSSSNLTHKEVTIKSETDGTTKQIVVPQHMLKLQSQGSGNIQAIQIPGKPGLQYVRVLAPGSSGSAAKVVSAIKKDASPTKTPVTGAQRVVMASSGKPGLSLINTSKDTTATTTKNNMRFISTVPTLRKIQDTTISRVPSNSQHDNETSSTHARQLIPIKKVNQSNVINNVKPEPKLLNSQVAISSIARQTTSSVQHQFVKKVESRTTINVEEIPRVKQFSTLKSPPLQINLQRTPDFTDDQISMLFTKRSPTPEALRRKHCNCTKSQCLKLYCDCFANGEFCQDCNCKECFNNLEYEDERQKAIKICLERNPNAFKPKITKAKDQSDLRLHNKGCNCKRSGCLKNYCECYEAKIACSSNCKCFGCRNVEDRSERELFEDNQPTAVVQQPTERPRAPKRTHDESAERYPLSSTSASTRLQDGQPANKQPYNFITQDVVDATIQCMIAQADECKKNGMNHKITERMIIEELGRCLVEIIDFSIRNMDN